MGPILAGAMAGAGEAGVKAANLYQRQAGELNMEKIKQELQGAREQALEGTRQQGAQALQASQQTFTSGENKLTREAEDTRQQRGFTHAETLQGMGFEHSEEMQRAQQDFLKGENAERNKLTSQEIASRERIAANNNAVSLQVAKIGGTVQQDKEGNMLFMGKDGTAKQIMDPNDPSKPLKGYKDLTPGAKAYSDVIKGQLEKLVTAETTASSMGDQAALTKISQQRADLNRELLNVLTGGIESAGKRAAVEPPAAAIAALRKDPKLAEDFKTKYGVDASKYLPGGGETAAKPPVDVGASYLPKASNRLVDRGMRGGYLDVEERLKAEEANQR